MAGRGRIRNMAAVDLLSELATDSVGAVVMDPPFFVSIGRAGDWQEKRGVGVDPWTQDSVSTIDHMIEWSLPLAVQVNRVLKPGGACVVMGGSQPITVWEVAATRAGMNWMAELTVLWNTGKPRARNFGSLTTTIRWHAKSGARHAFNSSDRRSIYSNVLVCDKVPLNERIHQAQKPVELTNFLISLLTTDGDTIVDPFCGSGSTLISAVMCDRPFIGGDTDADQCHIADERTRNIDDEEERLRPMWLWINGRTYPIEG